MHPPPLPNSDVRLSLFSFDVPFSVLTVAFTHILFFDFIFSVAVLLSRNYHIRYLTLSTLFFVRCIPSRSFSLARL